MASALALIEARARYGTQAGTKVWQAFRSADDPESPTTVHNDLSVSFGTPALIEATTTDQSATGILSNGILPEGYLDTPNRGISNALLVSGAHSAVTAPIMQSKLILNFNLDVNYRTRSETTSSAVAPGW
ncbi:MAG: hypothetical protein ACRDQ7_00665 [Haloechinothrix sp.]